MQRTGKTCRFPGVFTTYENQSILLRIECGCNNIALWDIWSFRGNSVFWNIIFNFINSEVRPMMAVDLTKLPEAVLII